jgi:hypothetical protein
MPLGDPLGISVQAPGPTLAGGNVAAAAGAGIPPIAPPVVPPLPGQVARGRAAQAAGQISRRFGSEAGGGAGGAGPMAGVVPGGAGQHQAFLAKHGLTQATRGTGAQARFQAAGGGRTYAGMTPPPMRAQRAAGFVKRRF